MDTDITLKENVRKLAKIKKKLVTKEDLDLEDITFLYNSTLMLGILLEHLKGVDLILESLSKVEDGAIIEPTIESHSVH